MSRACVVVVDFSKGFTDPRSPLHCDSDAALRATARLLEQARATGAPVVFTTVAYDAAGAQLASVFLEKAAALRALTPDSEWVAIDERIAPREGEPVIVKHFVSAFFGTSLASYLAAQRCDTIIVVGASTSGCVRATVVDGVQHGYRVVVPAEAVADRSQISHDTTLTDIGWRYADVVALEDALQLLGGAAVASGSTTT